MGVKIRSASPTSINLSWDSFLPLGSVKGQYVVYYTESYTETISDWPGVLEVSRVVPLKLVDIKTLYMRWLKEKGEKMPLKYYIAGLLTHLGCDDAKQEKKKVEFWSDIRF